MPVNQFDAIEWINNYPTHKFYLYQEGIKPITDFALIWNMFESIVCNKFAQVKSIKEAVIAAHDLGNLRVAEYDQYIEYFRNRYTPESGDYQNIWKGLSPTNHNTNSWPLILGILENSNKSDVENVQGLLLIAHRIRNNLFHGHKEVMTLNAQSDLFVEINRLLSTFIEDFDRPNFVT